MKKIKLLCLLITALMTSVSCSRIVHANYKTADRGKIIAADSIKSYLSIRSFSSDSCNNWYVVHTQWDELSSRGLIYTQNLSIGDTVYIYQDKSQVFASKCDVSDAKNINKALCIHYWQDIAQNWFCFLLLTAISGGALWVMVKVTKKAQAVPVVVICVCFIGTVCLTKAGYKLEMVLKGEVTQMTPDFVKINRSYIFPYADKNDIVTHKPVQCGKKVWLYRYTDSEYKCGEIFFSSHKLNEQALQFPQTYPEIWLMTSFLFAVMTLVLFFLFYYLSKVVDNIKKKKT